MFFTVVLSLVSLLGYLQYWRKNVSESSQSLPMRLVKSSWGWALGAYSARKSHQWLSSAYRMELMKYCTVLHNMWWTRIPSTDGWKSYWILILFTKLLINILKFWKGKYHAVGTEQSGWREHKEYFRRSWGKWQQGIWFVFVKSILIWLGAGDAGDSLIKWVPPLLSLLRLL